MEQHHKDAIEKLKLETDCIKDFMCCRKDFKDLQQFEILSFTDPPLVICKEQGYCKYKYEIVDHRFCTCSLRKYIAKSFSI